MSDDGGSSGGYDPSVPGGGSSTGYSFPDLYAANLSGGTVPLGGGASAPSAAGGAALSGLDSSGAFDPTQAGPSARGLALPSTVNAGSVDPTSLAGAPVMASGGDPVGGGAPAAGGGYAISKDLTDLMSPTAFSGYSPAGTPTGGTSSMTQDGSRTAVDPTTGDPVGPRMSTGGGADKSGGDGGILSKLGTGIVDSLTKNPLGIGAAATGLGINMFQKDKVSPAQQQVQTQATQLSAQGQQLASYLQSGTLPAGLQAVVDQAKNAAKQAIISRYAAAGQPTDPMKNPALQAELQQADTQAIMEIAKIGQGLLDEGIKESGMASDLYKSLMTVDQQKQQRTQQAISAFAAALGGGGGKRQDD